jgi:uncharacterized membrane protein
MTNDRHVAMHEISYDLRKRAREKLHRNWLKLFFGVLCYSLLTSGIAMVLVALFPGKFYFFGTNQTINMPWVASLFVAVFYGPMRLGLFGYILNFHDEGKISFFRIFGGFRHFIKAMGLYVIKMCLIFWPLFLVLMSAFMYIIVFATASNVNKIIIYNHVFFVIFMVMFLMAFAIAVIYMVYAKLKFSMAMILLADDGSKCAIKCLKESSDMMHGSKARLFHLVITYLGWFLLAFIPGIAVTFLMNYLFPGSKLEIITMPVAVAWILSLIPVVFVKEYLLTGVMGFYRKISAEK